MFRSVVSQVTRRGVGSRGHVPALSQQRVFHASSKREEEVAAKEAEAPAATSSWEPIYAVPLGIAFAVPAINYEWYLVNEETQLAACFVAFTAIVYKQFGGAISEMLEEDGKKILADANKVEDEILGILQEKRDDIIQQESIVQDAIDVQKLKEETYVKLNAAGKIKPQHEFKAQMERALSLIAAEEVAQQEKGKMALMEEATAAVKKELMTNKALQKASLDNAIAQLAKGTAGGKDPVKEAYLNFFKAKAASAQNIDEAAELAEARANIVTKLNAVAANEGFFFKLGPDGQPEMTV